MLKMMDPHEEKHTGWKRVDMTTSMIKRISTPIEIWEQRLKVMESTLDIEATRIPQLKTKQWLVCRNKPKQIHMIEISSEVFVVGPTWARSYSTIMYKAVHMTHEVSPNQHSQGFFKTQRDHCKKWPWIGGPLDVEPQSHIMHLLKRYSRSYLNSHL